MAKYPAFHCFVAVKEPRGEKCSLFFFRTKSQVEKARVSVILLLFIDLL
jgi:hypothetical protein